MSTKMRLNKNHNG